MSGYVDSIGMAPRTLTELEQRTLLKVSGEHRRGFRDHVIFSIALGTGLREFEITALDIGDVYDGRGKAKRRIKLRTFKRSNKNVNQQEVFVPDSLRFKLEKFYRWKLENKESVAPGAPLLMSQKGTRLGTRMIRHFFATWQERAGFDRHYSFHILRHSALQNLYDVTKDIRLVQRQARHANIHTTTIYAGPSDESVSRVVAAMPC